MFADGELDEESLALSSDAEIEARLTATPGIGPWTVRGFLLIALDRPDVFPAADLALRRSVKRLYGLDHLPSEDEMLGLAERWPALPQPRSRLPVRVGVREQLLSSDWTSTGSKP